MKLRDYQESISSEACEILKEYGLVYLALEVRTGKTLTAMAAAQKYGAKNVLFVTKKKAIESIDDDYEKIEFGFHLDTINYEQLHNYKGRPDLVILDEAHGIGQFPKPANRTILLKDLCEGLPIIYLSGTPSAESYSQLFHQFYVSSRSPFAEYKNFYKWAAEFVKIGKKYFHGHAVNDYSKARKDMIDEATKHLFISFTQEEAGFQSMVEEEILVVKMKEATYWLVEKIRKDGIHTGKGGEVVLADTAVKKMQKLHQIYSGTCIVEPELGQPRAISFDESKAEFILKHFQDQKIAIFYKFVAEEMMLLWVASKHGRKTTTDPKQFNEREDMIFLSQIQSGREGINLSTADALVMMNIDFSAISYWQTRARIQTRDREKVARVYWIFSENGIEYKIYDAVSNKKDYTLSYFKKDYEKI